jgi:rhamnosyltransferase
MSTINPNKLLKENICAIIVTFNPQGDLESRVLSIFHQVGCVLIVDNLSNSNTVLLIKDICSRYNINFIINDKNYGIATALNKGVQWATNNNFKWIMTFDQDTVVKDDIVNQLINSYYDCSFKEKIAIIGSHYENPNNISPNMHSQSSYDKLYVEAKFVITSGSLMPIKIFNDIGYFRDDFFIDFVDIEFCLRARSKGFKVIKTKKASMIHDIGTTSMHRMLWKKTGTSNHSPIRRYFIMRNHILVLKEYFLFDPKFLICSIIDRIQSLILIYFFEKDRSLKIKYSMLGLFDGILGRMNRFQC